MKTKAIENLVTEYYIENESANVLKSWNFANIGLKLNCGWVKTNTQKMQGGSVL